MVKVPRVRTRLIALTVGVALVVGSTVLVVRSNLASDAFFGFGGRVAWWTGHYEAFSPYRGRGVWVAMAYAHHGVVEVRGIGIKNSMDLNLTIDDSGAVPTRWQELLVESERVRTGVWAATGENDVLVVRLSDGGCSESPELEFTDLERESALRMLGDRLSQNPHPDVKHYWIDEALLAT